MENKRYAVSWAFTWGEERYLNANIEEKIDADAKERLATELARMLKKRNGFWKRISCSDHEKKGKRKRRRNVYLRNEYNGGQSGRRSKTGTKTVYKRAAIKRRPFMLLTNINRRAALTARPAPRYWDLSSAPALSSSRRSL